MEVQHMNTGVSYLWHNDKDINQGMSQVLLPNLCHCKNMQLKILIIELLWIIIAATTM